MGRLCGVGGPGRCSSWRGHRPRWRRGAGRALGTHWCQTRKCAANCCGGRRVCGCAGEQHTGDRIRNKDWIRDRAARLRTASRRARRLETEQRTARVDRMLSIFQHGDITPDMSKGDINSANRLNKDCMRGPEGIIAARSQPLLFQLKKHIGRC